MLNDVDEDYFKHHLQCQKNTLKNERHFKYFRMMANSGGDLLDNMS